MTKKKRNSTKYQAALFSRTFLGIKSLLHKNSPGFLKKLLGLDFWNGVTRLHKKGEKFYPLKLHWAPSTLYMLAWNNFKELIPERNQASDYPHITKTESSISYNKRPSQVKWENWSENYSYLKFSLTCHTITSHFWL